MTAHRLIAFTVRSLTAGALVIVSSIVCAGQPSDITPTEMALIPPYCRDAQTFGYGDAYYNTSPNAAKWVGMMGKGFWAIHHYCWALINLGRAERPSTPRVIVTGLRESAIQDMEYVINHADPDFVLLPELYTKIGNVQLMLKNPTSAHDSFAKARVLKPDYWPAYAGWAEYLQAAGYKAQAREVVANGLAHAPSSRTLRQMFVELGGNPASIPRGEGQAATEKPDKATPR
jgi:tetratricopeptide (TPR) repeat protein